MRASDSTLHCTFWWGNSANVGENEGEENGDTGAEEEDHNVLHRPHELVHEPGGSRQSKMVVDFKLQQHQGSRSSTDPYISWAKRLPNKYIKWREVINSSSLAHPHNNTTSPYITHTQESLKINVLNPWFVQQVKDKMKTQVKDCSGKCQLIFISNLETEFYEPGLPT